MNYNIKDILKYIYKKKNIKKKQIKIIIKSFFKKILKLLKNNINIKIQKFGKFITYKKQKYIWKNPKTKKNIIIPSKKKIKFIISKKFTKEINNK